MQFEFCPFCCSPIFRCKKPDHYECRDCGAAVVIKVWEKDRPKDKYDHFMPLFERFSVSALTDTLIECLTCDEGGAA